MLKLNRTTEYALIALRHMSQKSAINTLSLTSARELADAYGLPFEITAKTLQRLRDSGLIQSSQGARGGYSLGKSLREVSLSEFIGLMEGTAGMVQCVSEEHTSCDLLGKCAIKGVMLDLNSRMNKFLSEIPLAEIAGLGQPVSARASMALAVGEEP